MDNWFAPLDKFLGVILAFVTYLCVQAIAERFGFDPNFIGTQAVAAVVGILVGAVASRRLWGWPIFQLTWQVGDQAPIKTNSFHMRLQDGRDRRVVTHSVTANPRSVFAVWAVKRIKAGGVRLKVEVQPRGVLHFIDDFTPDGTETLVSTAGFEHTIPDFDKTGDIGYVRIEWRIKDKSPRVCPVNYRLEVSGKQGRVLRRLVILRAKVKQVDLAR